MSRGSSIDAICFLSSIAARSAFLWSLILCCLVSLGYLWRGADAWARPGTRWAARYGHGTRWATKISKPSRFAYPSRFRSRSRSRGVGRLPWLNLPAQKMSSYRDTANFGVRCHVTPRVVGFGCMACRFLKPFSLRVTPGRFLYGRLLPRRETVNPSAGPSVGTYRTTSNGRSEQ